MDRRDIGFVQAPASVTKTPAFARIIVSARRHFFTHGFRSVTMDDLADELGMSKKTLYACSPSKAALLEAVLRDKFREIDADLRRIAANRPSHFPSALHRLLDCVRRHTEEIQPAFVRDLRREAPEMFKLVEIRRRQVLQRHFGKLLRVGRGAGIIRKDIPVRLIVEILLGATEAIVNPTKMAELRLTPQTGFSSVISVVLDGVITQKGRAKL